MKTITIAAAFLFASAAVSAQENYSGYTDFVVTKTEGNWSPRIINLGDTGTPPAVADVLAAARSVLAQNPSPVQS